MSKYTKIQIEKVIKESYSWAEVCRILGIKQVGGSQAHIKSRAISFNIDFSHFTSKAWSKGKILTNKRRNLETILILRTKGYREKAYLLKRALLESKIDYICSICNISDWQSKKITLEIDHIDGNYLNDTLQNLRFLCPNCHSQTGTYKNKKR